MSEAIEKFLVAMLAVAFIAGAATVGTIWALLEWFAI